MSLTPALCRGARGLLGWTIDELAAESGVSASTIISFEAGQRVPIRANLEALTRALDAGGFNFMGADEDGTRIKLKKTAEAVRDVLLIGALHEPRDARLDRARQRIERFRGEAADYYTKFSGPGPEIAARVHSDTCKLRDQVDWEIGRRLRLQRHDKTSQFLEPITDHLHAITAA